jgi:hypothetical protein
MYTGPALLCAEEKAESSIDPLGGEILVLTEMGDLDGGVNGRLSATAGRLNCLAPRRWIGGSIKQAAIGCASWCARALRASFSIGAISGRCLQYLARGYIKRLSFSRGREPSSFNLVISFADFNRRRRSGIRTRPAAGRANNNNNTTMALQTAVESPGTRARLVLEFVIDRARA